MLSTVDLRQVVHAEYSTVDKLYMLSTVDLRQVVHAQYSGQVVHADSAKSL